MAIDLTDFETTAADLYHVAMASDPYVQAGLAFYTGDVEKAITHAKQLKAKGNLTDTEIEENLSIAARSFQQVAMMLLGGSTQPGSTKSEQVAAIKTAIAANSESRACLEQLQTTRNKRKKKAAGRKNFKRSAKIKNSLKVQDVLREAQKVR